MWTLWFGKIIVFYQIFGEWGFWFPLFYYIYHFIPILKVNYRFFVDIVDFSSVCEGFYINSFVDILDLFVILAFTRGLAYQKQHHSTYLQHVLHLLLAVLSWSEMLKMIELVLSGVVGGWWRGYHHVAGVVDCCDH